MFTITLGHTGKDVRNGYFGESCLLDEAVLHYPTKEDFLRDLSRSINSAKSAIHSELHGVYNLTEFVYSRLRPAKVTIEWHPKTDASLTFGRQGKIFLKERGLK